MAPSADSIIATLNLTAHPEGGYFRETFRDDSSSPQQSRPASTLIYYLLRSTQFSALHRLDATEVWHFYAGTAALEVVELPVDGDGRVGPKVTRLGMRLEEGERPQCVVGKGTWFGARLAREGGGGEGEGERWALVGCTVAPGFLFEKFEMGSRERLLAEWPGCEDVVRELTRDG
ncbi:uncharacterized protein HMPREF1541_03474 [Cyphellophora europaea CBS 101466]|uniref:DUF985 domain-containing protein n=1 Tax=Cyphellophora europaea (strain CBS 101466) TaxID=1220924 RepID=W2S0H4_CYPE1|nr:uncharacterized protein HMPREF1541_03474 [Cyphellophora europaea CBS 101466]ETN41538.1 hypothetical protein HMPREF1541_03474 [Cyphellophora europaea CBS 101466]